MTMFRSLTLRLTAALATNSVHGRRKSVSAFVDPHLSLKSRRCPLSCLSLHKSLSTSKVVFTSGAQNITINEDKSSIAIQWYDEPHPTNFHAVWLRWQCWCPECRNPELGQTLYTAEKLGYNYTIDDITEEGNDLVMKFGGCESHVGKLPLSWLKKNQYDKKELAKYSDATRPAPFKPPTPMEYADFIASPEATFKVMIDLAINGAALLKNAPLEYGLIRDIGKRIAEDLYYGYYGDVFDIHVNEDSNDFTNRSYGLPLHMDFLYGESPPNFMLMYCLAFDDCVEGGESVYLDIFYEAERFRKTHPKDFDILTKVPTTYQREINMDDKSGHYTMTYCRPHFTLNHTGDLIEVGWATDTHGPILAEPHLVPAYYEAYSKFTKQIYESPYAFTYRMKSGDVFLFNNRTLLHTRNGFKQNGGLRHIQSACLTSEDFRTKLMQLAMQLGESVPPLKLGDRDYNFRLPTQIIAS